MAEEFLAAMQAAAARQEEDMRALEAGVEELQRVRQLLARLPDKVRHKAMVPYGRHAFFEGELVHTNEFHVDLGCGYSLEASAREADGVLARRQARAERALAEARAQQEELRNKERELAGALSNEEGEAFVEIRQEYEESEELLRSAVAPGPAATAPAGTEAEGEAEAAEAAPAASARAAGSPGAPGTVAAPSGASSGSVAAAGKGRSSAHDTSDDDRIFARLAELERLEAAAGPGRSSSSDGSSGEEDDGGAAPGPSAAAAVRQAAAANAGKPSTAVQGVPSGAAAPAAVAPAASAGAGGDGSGTGAVQAPSAAAQGTDGSKRQPAAAPFRKGFLLGNSKGGRGVGGSSSSSSGKAGASPNAEPAKGSSSARSPDLASPSTTPSATTSKLAGTENRRRVSFAEAPAPGQGESTSTGLGPGSRPSQGPSGEALRPALRQTALAPAVAQPAAQAERVSSGRPRGGAKGEVLEREGDAAMAMARAREEAFTGLVLERVGEAEDGGGTVAAAVVRVPEAEAAPPRRVSKFKAQRMGLE